MSIVAESVPSEVSGFLSSAPLKAYVGGQWVEAADGVTLTTHDPGTDQPLAQVPAMGAEDVNQAVKAAEKAFQTSGWATMNTNERGVMLHRLTDLVEEHKSSLAWIESLDAGKVLGQAEGDVQNFIDTMRYFIAMSLNIPRRVLLAEECDVTIEDDVRRSIEETTEQIIDYDVQFHLGMVSLAKNLILEMILKSLLGIFRPHLIQLFWDEIHKEKTDLSHQKLYQTLVDGNAETARNEMRVHLGMAYDSLLKKKVLLD